MSNQKDSHCENHHKGLSRRGFLGSVVVAGAATAALAIPGCSTTQTGTAQKTPAPLSGNHSFEIMETDVIVVGGGLAGILAAKKVVAENQNVILVDKGPFGHSGASGINWGHVITTMEYCENPDDSVPALVSMQEGMGDQQYLLSLCQNSAESKAIEFSHKAGCISYRTPKGVAALVKDAPAATYRDNGAFPRLWARSVREEGIKVIDRTMVVDVVLSPSGETAGVVAIDLMSGEPKVIRSKTVVMAAGSHAWTFGKCTNGAHSMGGPELTGDGLSIFLKLGAELVNMEQMICTPTQNYPDGVGYSMGCLMAGVTSWNIVCDAEGNTFTEMLTGGKDVQDIGLIPTFGGQPGRMMLRVLYDKGSIYATSDESVYPRYLARVRENHEKFLGYTCPPYVELAPDLWETAGHPVVDPSGESTVANLFWAGSGEASWRGSACIGSIGSGHMAGKGAAQKAANMEMPEVDWDRVSTTLDECYELLQRDASKGKSALEVYTSIQQAMYEGCYPIRTEEQLKGAIATLEKIRDEDIPNMYVRDSSKLCNPEWRQALEVPHMWNCVMATAQSALARTETRGNHVRLDYPVLDNENWLKFVAVSVNDSTWNVTTKEFDTSIVSKDEIKEMISADSSMFEDVVIH